MLQRGGGFECVSGLIPSASFSVTVLGFAVNRNTLGHGGSSMDTGNKLSWFRRHPFASAALVFTAIAVGLLSTTEARAEKNDAGAALAAPARTGGDIINNAASIRLGKALFWDSQSGGDGPIACATWHFHAGAVLRHVNSLRCARNCVAIRSWKSPSSHSTLYAAGIGAT